MELMGPDHRFVDAGGQAFRGRDAMRDAWIDYYRLFPDYEIEIEEVLSRDDVVALFGLARGTYALDGELRPDYRWEVPAAWKAVVRAGKVVLWSFFADHEPVHRLMERSLE
jgi:hypothetical protein